jgi:hypothetical protein
LKESPSFALLALSKIASKNCWKNNKLHALNSDEEQELDLYEEIDDYFSFINRTVRNLYLTQSQSDVCDAALCLTERSLTTMFATFVSKFHVFALISLRIIGIRTFRCPTNCFYMPS